MRLLNCSTTLDIDHQGAFHPNGGHCRPPQHSRPLWAPQAEYEDPDGRDGDDDHRHDDYRHEGQESPTEEPQQAHPLFSDNVLAVRVDDRMRDNGMMNSGFLDRCRAIGYVRMRDILPHYRDMLAHKYPNGVGLTLPYGYLSTSEQMQIDRDMLKDAGYRYGVALPWKDRSDRRTLQMLLANDHRMAPWTHEMIFNEGSVFLFTQEKDALHFRLSVQ